jgi:hypothetical protein
MNGNSVGNSENNAGFAPSLDIPISQLPFPSIEDWYRLYVTGCRYGQQFGSVGKSQKTAHVQKRVIERKTRQERHKTGKAGRV